MDFIQALKEADAVGIPRQQFMIVWENETRLKQTENELRLQQMKTENGKVQTYGDSRTITNQIETQLQNFNAHQQQVLAHLNEQLQQQNSALIADISLLLEGFASHMGRVVKGEIQTGLESLNLSASGLNNKPQPTGTRQTVASDQGSNKTWSKVHVVQESNESISSIGAEANLEDPLDQRNGSAVWNGAGQVIQVQQQQEIKSEQNKVNGKQQTSDAEEAPKPRSFSSLFNGTTKFTSKKEDVSPSGYFFPPNGSVNMMVFEMSKIAQMGKITSSPVYYLQDSPCKMQLSVWSSAQMDMRMCLTISNATPQQVQVPQILTISGSVYNWKSLKYTSLFYLKTPPLDLQTQESKKMELPLVLNTSRGSYPNVTVETLFKRGYVNDNRDCISIDWTVKSKVYEA